MKFFIKRFSKTVKALRENDGYSILELMVAIVIIGIISVAAVQSYNGVTNKAKVTRTKQDLATLGATLDRYNLDNGNYPTTEQGLLALIEEPTTEPIPSGYNSGGYLRGKKLPKDGWGHEFYYACPGSDGGDYDLISYGADGQQGGEDKNADISIWDLQ